VDEESLMYRCNKIKPGKDKGQRYVVIAYERSELPRIEGKEVTIGWTDKRNGSFLFEMARKWPAVVNPKVMDRRPEGPDEKGRCMMCGLVWQEEGESHICPPGF
jgi:hypothetical protein